MKRIYIKFILPIPFSLFMTHRKVDFSNYTTYEILISLTDEKQCAFARFLEHDIEREERTREEKERRNEDEKEREKENRAQKKQHKLRTNREREKEMSYLKSYADAVKRPKVKIRDPIKEFNVEQTNVYLNALIYSIYLNFLYKKFSFLLRTYLEVLRDSMENR